MYCNWNFNDFAAAYEASEKRRSKRRGRRYGYRRPKYNIPVNIIENPTEFIVHVHAVGFAKDEIKVSVVADMLYISGRRTPEDDAPNFILQEYPIKSFERSFELSARVDKEGIVAQYKDGILTLVVPKTTEAQAPEQTIDIE